MKDHTALMIGLILALIIGLVLLGKEKLDNPLFFLSMVAVFVFAFGAFGRWAGNKVGAPGLVAFFGGK